jgi:hypothetical protein
MTSNDTPGKLYCNVLAQEKGLDAAGYAGVFDTAFVLELPLPWPYDLLSAPDKLPAELVQIVQKILAMPPEDRPRVRPLFIAPDEHYSQPGYRRFIYYSRPAGAFARYDRVEYLVPDEKVGQIIQAFHEAPDDVTEFEVYRVDTDNVRDIMVCTHGTVDVACAKFGYPLYKHLRDEFADDPVRVWRVNHFGGHVFAPTLMDMPKGDYWGFVDEADAPLIVNREGDIQSLRTKYRGWSGMPYAFAQVMERDILMREGWTWQHYLKQGEILDTDKQKNPEWAEIRITYQSKDGTVSGIYEGRVSVDNHVQTIGSTGAEDEFSYPQYAVTNLRHQATG